VAANYSKPTDSLQKLISEMQEPLNDAPEESKTLKLVEQGFGGVEYNLTRYLDRYWLIHWQEGSFEVNKILAGESKFPILVADSREELEVSLQHIYGPSLQIDTSKLEGEWFTLVRKNLYLTEIPHDDAIKHQIAGTPHYKNRQIPLENLFEPGNGEPITLLCIAPSRTCNYRCHYCYHHDHGFTKNSDAMEQWAKSILIAGERIPRPIRFSAGAMGEPLIMKKWRDTTIKLLKRDNVISLSFVSNLFNPLEPFFDHVDPNKVGVMASLHPSEYKDHDQDLKNFLDKLAKLKSLGVDLVVNYVLAPGQIEQFKGYQKLVHALGIPTTSNVLRGPFKGKVYPEAFSPEEMELIDSCYDENSFIFDSQSHLKNPYGIECVSGRKGFELLFDGTLINCGFARNRFGSIFDDTLMIRKENSACTASECECQTLIGWQVDVERKFKVQRTLQHYVKVA